MSGENSNPLGPSPEEEFVAGISPNDDHQPLRDVLSEGRAEGGEPAVGRPDQEGAKEVEESEAKKTLQDAHARLEEAQTDFATEPLTKMGFLLETEGGVVQQKMLAAAEYEGETAVDELRATVVRAKYEVDHLSGDHYTITEDLRNGVIERNGRIAEAATGVEAVDRGLETEDEVEKDLREGCVDLIDKFGRLKLDTPHELERLRSYDAMDYVSQQLNVVALALESGEATIAEAKDRLGQLALDLRHELLLHGRLVDSVRRADQTDREAIGNIQARLEGLLAA